MARFKSVIFTTSKLNTYMFSNSLGCVLYIHPIMIHLLKNKSENNKYEYTNTDLYSENEIDYYQRKIDFYTRYLVFESAVKDHLFIDNISENDIIKSISNTEQLAIELIQDCNLQCKYCIYGSLYKNPFKYNKIKSNDVQKIIDRLLCYWEFGVTKNIRINYYGGESLLRFEDIQQITEYIKSKNTSVNFTFGLTTNGTLLDAYKIDYFVKNNFVLAISLDGNEESNRYRVYKNGNETYNTIINNMMFIKEKYPRYYSDNIHYISVLHDKNKNLNIKHFFLNYLNTDKVNTGSLNKIDVNEDNISVFNKMFRTNYSVKDGFIINKHIYRYQKEIFRIRDIYSFPEYLHKKSNKRMYTGTCIPLKKKLFITAEYQLMPCEKISFNNNYGLICNNGNIQNINHKYIAEQYNKNIKTVISQCKKCYYSMLCSFCIFTLQNKGDGYYCNRHMTIRRFSIYLSNIFTYLENNKSIKL